MTMPKPRRSTKTVRKTTKRIERDGTRRLNSRAKEPTRFACGSARSHVGAGSASDLPKKHPVSTEGFAAAAAAAGVRVVHREARAAHVLDPVDRAVVQLQRARL